MKQFFKFMFATIAGMIVMGLISIVILIGIISSLSSTEESTKVKD